MATVEDSADSGSANDNSTVDETNTLVLEAAGDAKRYRGHTDEMESVVTTDTVHVEVEITYTLEELKVQFFKSSHTGLKFQNPIQHAPRCVLREMVDEKTSKDGVDVSRNNFDGWDVTLDGDVRAWLNFLDLLPDSIRLDRAKRIQEFDVFGDGLDAAIIELKRRA